MKKGQIIIIEDNKAEMKLLQEAFHHLKFEREIVGITDPEAAFQYIKKHIKEIFLILCDVKMPRLTGPELLEKINADPALRLLAIPFIFLSNSEDQGDIEHAYSLSAQGYFQKPLDLDKLIHLCSQIVGYWTEARIPRDKYQYTH